MGLDWAKDRARRTARGAARAELDDADFDDAVIARYLAPTKSEMRAAAVPLIARWMATSRPHRLRCQSCGHTGILTISADRAAAARMRCSRCGGTKVDAKRLRTARQPHRPQNSSFCSRP